MHGELQSRFNFAVSQEFHRNVTLGYKPLRSKVFRRDFLPSLEHAQLLQIDDLKLLAEGGIRETALGQAAVQRHLAAFKTGLVGISGSGLLTLVSLAAGTSLSGAGAPSQAASARARSGGGLQGVQFQSLLGLVSHRSPPREADAELFHHPLYGRIIRMNYRLLEFAQTQGTNDLLVDLRAVDGAANISDFQLAHGETNPFPKSGGRARRADGIRSAGHGSAPGRSWRL